MQSEREWKAGERKNRMRKEGMEEDWKVSVCEIKEEEEYGEKGRNIIKKAREFMWKLERERLMWERKEEEEDYKDAGKWKMWDYV